MSSPPYTPNPRPGLFLCSLDGGRVWSGSQAHPKESWVTSLPSNFLKALSSGDRTRPEGILIVPF